MADQLAEKNRQWSSSTRTMRTQMKSTIPLSQLAHESGKAHVEHSKTRCHNMLSITTLNNIVPNKITVVMHIPFTADRPLLPSANGHSHSCFPHDAPRNRGRLEKHLYDWMAYMLPTSLKALISTPDIHFLVEPSADGLKLKRTSILYVMCRIR